MEVNRYNHIWSVRKETNDMGIVDEVFNIPMYDLNHFNKVDVCLDIGAHIGSFTIKAKKKFPDCIIHSYEPIIENYDLMIKNINGLRGITCHNATVSGRRLPSSLLQKGTANTGSNIFVYGEKATDEIYRYNNELIWDIQQKLGYIDLLKIDCEGGENSIFEDIDWSKIGGVIAELHTYGATKPFDDMFKSLESAGFKTLHKAVLNVSIAEYVGKK